MNNAERRSRLRLMAGGLASGAFVMLGLGCADNSIALNPTAPATIRSETQPLTLPDQVLKLYPETQGLIPRSIHKITTNPISSTTVINLTNSEFNLKAISDTYSAVQNYLNLRHAYPFWRENRELRLIITPREYRDRTTLFISSYAKKPQWSNALAATHIDIDQKYVLAYVQETSYENDSLATTPQAGATLGFSVEVCQQLINVVTTDVNGIKIEDLNLQTEGQEVFCNSYGRLVAAKLLGMSYDQYKKYAEQYRLWSPKDASRYSPAFVFPTTFYDSLPTSGPILK